jgi:glycosyltransferase involved in cell wall biosynthesis
VEDLAKAAEGSELKGIQICVLGKKILLFDRFSPRIVDYDGRYNRIVTLLKTARRLRKVLKAERPSILHTHGWDADIIGWLSNWGLEIKHIAHLHVAPEWLHSRGISHRVRRLLTRQAFGRPGTWLVAVSVAVMRHWVAFLPWKDEEIRVIRNGIDVSCFQPSINLRCTDNEPVVIGVAARLAPMKGIEYLLDALGILAREGLTFRLKIAGEGGHRAILESCVQEAGIGNQTLFLGHLENMPAFYHSIDIYVLPSISTEGLPLGILEAMASGLPVVATAVGGASEAVRDGLDGLLVLPRSSEALALALRKIINDKKLRRRMGEASRQRAVAAFSLERFAGEIFKFYHEIAESECI